MSNIDKRALREAAEKAQTARARLESIPDEDVVLFEENDIKSDVFVCNKFIVTANPANVLALLDELEAKDKLNAELMEKQRLIDICQGQGLEHRIAAEKRAEAAEKRIAELERERVAMEAVTLAMRDDMRAAAAGKGE